MRVKGIISYDGSNYHGYQVQTNKNLKTIQYELETLISKIFNREIKVVASGRTDQGVHALKQVICFQINKGEYDLQKLTYVLNRMLPRDIVILSLEEVDDEFHPRISAKGKHYQYRINRVRNPFLVKYSYYYPKQINLELINKGIEAFKGTHCFYNFCSNKELDIDYNKTIYDLKIKVTDQDIIFDIYGDGFKRYMVRMIIGTLLALSEGRIDVEYIKTRLNTMDKMTTMFNAPSHGLYLMEVYYD